MQARETTNRQIPSSIPGIAPPLPFSAPQLSECFLYIANSGGLLEEREVALKNCDFLDRRFILTSCCGNFALLYNVRTAVTQTAVRLFRQRKLFRSTNRKLPFALPA
jgi:hypothetical protein